MVLYTQLQDGYTSFQVSIALSTTRVWLILEDFASMNEENSNRVVSISSNPKYIDWLNANKNNLSELFMNNKWFISPDHRNGSTKYLTELKWEIAYLVNPY